MTEESVLAVKFRNERGVGPWERFMIPMPPSHGEFIIRIAELAKLEDHKNYDFWVEIEGYEVNLPKDYSVIKTHKMVAVEYRHKDYEAMEAMEGRRCLVM